MAQTLRQCRFCQRRVLDSFTSLTGISVLRPLHKTATPSVPALPQSRRFSSSLWAAQSLPESSLARSDVTGVSEQSQTSTSIPWYLQVETPEPPPRLSASPILASQEIPKIPDDAPSILDPILHHLSISIGLDNLALIDLRSFTDPPPALGSNLFMIIGTARSNKHLNSSADRFCRWLRSTYKIRPYADGLLGRNELKLKLRRKNRRLKLAQSVGNTLAMADSGVGGKYDDGITTGWICCNLGQVDEAVIPQEGEGAIRGDTFSRSGSDQEMIAKEEEEEEDDDDEYSNPSETDFFAGFGHRSDAPKIVVQMFTEDKRLEMDLEGLWDARKQRKVDKM